MVQWSPAVFVRLLEFARRNGVEKRYNTYYIKGVATVQCNKFSINVYVKDSELHIYYNPVTGTYQAYQTPILSYVPSAGLLFAEGEKLCKELEKMSVSTPKVPGTGGMVSTPSLASNDSDAGVDTIIARLNLETNRLVARGETYKKAKEYVRLNFRECYEIIAYFGIDKPEVELIYAIYGREYQRAENVLSRIAMDCTEPECIQRIGQFFDECRKKLIKPPK